MEIEKDDILDNVVLNKRALSYISKSIYNSLKNQEFNYSKYRDRNSNIFLESMDVSIIVLTFRDILEYENKNGKFMEILNMLSSGWIILHSSESQNYGDYVTVILGYEDKKGETNDG